MVLTQALCPFSVIVAAQRWLLAVKRASAGSTEKDFRARRSSWLRDRLACRGGRGLRCYRTTSEHGGSATGAVFTGFHLWTAWSNWVMHRPIISRMRTAFQKTM